MFGRPAPAGAMTPSFTPAGQQMVYDTPNYAYGMLANDLTGKRMVPVRGRIHARKLSDFADYIRHSGEEFVFVLSGELELRFENGHAYRLGAGDSLYFDSAVGHVYLSLGDTDAECSRAASTAMPAAARRDLTSDGLNAITRRCRAPPRNTGIPITIRTMHPAARLAPACDLQPERSR